jgi:peptidoglycan/xylan/chitin deacetylase (PgdA/CDA1 family)
LEKEVIGSKVEIEDRLGGTVDSFAYPYGHFDPRVLTLVREHFTAACTTDLAFVRAGSNPWCLERVDAYYLRSRLFPRYLRSTLARAYLHGRRTLRGIRHSHTPAKPMEVPVGEDRITA